jgi:hypothetical protein
MPGLLKSMVGSVNSKMDRSSDSVLGVLNMVGSVNSKIDRSNELRSRLAELPNLSSEA